MKGVQDFIKPMAETEKKSLSELISDLKHDSEYLRMKAARLLYFEATEDDLDQLQAIYHLEDVVWIKNAIRSVIDKIKSTALIETPNQKTHYSGEDNNIDELKKKIRGEAIDATIGRILHEIDPLIGTIRTKLKAELHSYAESETLEAIERLDEVLTVFEDWQAVERPPRINVFRVHDFISEVIKNSNLEGINLSLNGDDSIEIESDKRMLRIIFTNALRNAIDAIRESATCKENARIVVSWSVTDKHFSFSVVDNGIGLDSSLPILKASFTTKAGHKGMGLSLAIDAAASLSGSVEVSPGKQSGAVFYCELPLVSSR